MAEDKKDYTLITLLFSLIGVPFVVTLVKFFQKGPNEPVTMKDLMAIFGLQVLIAACMLIYLVFFHNAVAVLG